MSKMWGIYRVKQTDVSLSKTISTSSDYSGIRVCYIIIEALGESLEVPPKCFEKELRTE